MVARSLDLATDCERESTDWTTIGTRILHAALIASAIHTRECSHRPEMDMTGAGGSATDCELSSDRLEAGPAWE
jgi:hypothetical protein